MSETVFHAISNNNAGAAESNPFLKITHKIGAWLTAAALLVSFGVMVSFWSFRQIEQAAEARQQTNAVIKNADNLLSAMKDAETGQRGFLLTGDETFLEPYLAVRDRIGEHLEQLRRLDTISAAHEHLNALPPLIDAKLAEMSQVIELRRNHDLATALARIKSGQGKQSMDSIRAEIGGFIKVEVEALARNEAAFQSNMRRLFAIIVTASVLALLFALVFVWLIYRQTQQRLKTLVHLETEHLLETQEAMNRQLRQANLTLRDSEEKLAVTLSSIGDAVIATDAEARVTLLNSVAEQLTGWTQTEAAGRPVHEVFDIVNKESRRPATIPVMETLAHGTVQGLANHTVLIARDGSECDIADSCAPIRDRDGQASLNN